jgi:hypothetical protein
VEAFHSLCASFARDLGKLQSADEAAGWVHTNLAAKNILIAANADMVEAGFRDRLATIKWTSAAPHRESQPACLEMLVRTSASRSFATIYSGLWCLEPVQ